jgi:hypothetical protein
VTALPTSRDCVCSHAHDGMELTIELPGE